MSGLLHRLPLVLGVIAIVVGLALAVAWLHAPRTAITAQPVATPAVVLVAARPVAPGALLRDGDLAWRPLAGGPAPAGAFVQGATAKEALVGAAALRGINPGELLLADAVVRPDQRNFLAATLAPGLRAVTISVDAPQSASGLVLPGDRVDVVLVQEVGDGARRMAAETVLRNSRVLAVGRSIAEKPGAAPHDAMGNSPRTITLEATPHDAERLYLASRLGDLQLALRGPGDIAEAPDSVPVWAGDVSDAAKWRSGPAAPADPHAAAAPAVRARAAATAEREPVLILRGGAL